MKNNTTAKDLLVEDEVCLLQNRLCEIVSSKVINRRTGKKSEFYRLVFSDWVNIIALTDRKEILLIKQFRFGTEKIELEIPGGAIDPGEQPLRAGQRELLEETGYSGSNARVIGRVCPNPAIQNNWCYTVLIEDVQPTAEQRMDDMEDIEVISMPLSQVDALIANGDINHGLVLNALMHYTRQYR